jgi:hypothetical protein
VKQQILQIVVHAVKDRWRSTITSTETKKCRITPKAQSIIPILTTT